MVRRSDPTAHSGTDDIPTDINLDGVEFNVLPSGLHLVERDIVYVDSMHEVFSLSDECIHRHFSHSSFTGLAIYRRRPTLSHGHRGFRLSSLGILINASQCPRPWMHLDSLEAVADEVYGRAEKREEEENAQGRPDDDAGSVKTGSIVSVGDLREEDFAPARQWFEERKAKEVVSIPTEKMWNGWSDELDGVSSTIFCISLMKADFFETLKRLEVRLSARADLSPPTPPSYTWALLAHSVQVYPRKTAHYDIYAPSG